MPLLLVLLCLALTSCNSPQKTGSAKFYFNQAVYYKEKQNHIKSLEYLRKLRQEFFYSPYNEKALLMKADIYFAQKKFPQAVQSYEKYLDLYPHKQKDYALYQIGLSYKNQLPSRSEHDLSLSDPALKAFSLLLKLKSPYRKKALRAKREILDQKASRELKTALFFKSQGWRSAGLKRIKYFIKHYPQSPLMPKALLTGFQLAHSLNSNTAEFKSKLMTDYPHSPSARLLQKKHGFFSKIKQQFL